MTTKRPQADLCPRTVSLFLLPPSLQLNSSYPRFTCRRSSCAQPKATPPSSPFRYYSLYFHPATQIKKMPTHNRNHLKSRPFPTSRKEEDEKTTKWKRKVGIMHTTKSHQHQKPPPSTSAHRTYSLSGDPAVQSVSAAWACEPRERVLWPAGPGSGPDSGVAGWSSWP